MEQEKPGEGRARVGLRDVRYLLGQAHQRHRRDSGTSACRGRRRGAWRGTWTHHRASYGESERMLAGYLPVDGVYAGWLVDLGAKTADDDAQDTSEGCFAAVRFLFRGRATCRSFAVSLACCVSIDAKRPSTR